LTAPEEGSFFSSTAVFVLIKSAGYHLSTQEMDVAGFSAPNRFNAFFKTIGSGCLAVSGITGRELLGIL
jgi:hypothetical protein